MFAESFARPQIYALADANNFYVECERTFNPSLKNRPVVVLSNNDGCAISRSAEAKALNIKMGTPWFQLRDLVKSHGLIALSSNYVLYADLSDRFSSILRSFSPSLEVYSVDETFLSCDGLDRLWPSPTAMGKAMRDRVLQWCGLPICVGFGNGSKTLAKLANHIAKTQKEFDGVCDLGTLPPGERDALFASIEVGEVWGVGRRSADKLQDMGIATAKDLRDASPKWIRSRFSVVLERTVLELNGVSCQVLEEITPAKQQIICSRSFGQPVLTFDELRESVSSYTARAAEKLRMQSSVCGAVQVFIETNRFRPQDRQYSNGMTVCLAAPSDDTRQLVGAAIQGLRSIYRPGYQYKKSGVMLTDLTNKTISQSQLTLYTDALVNQKSARLMQTMDALNTRFGRNAVTLASSGYQQCWQARFERRSQRYTTCWDELPVAHAS